MRNLIEKWRRHRAEKKVVKFLDDNGFELLDYQKEIFLAYVRRHNSINKTP